MSSPDVIAVASELRTLCDEIRTAAGDERSSGDPSIANMRAYLALRRHDNRGLQAALARRGLSSLGRSEAHVLATLEQVLGIVEPLAADAPTATVSFDESSALLRRRARTLFGDGPPNRRTSIMVTLPSEAASNPALVRSLVDAGMHCARINSAHDDEDAWTAMASHVRAAATASNRRVPILVDLPGPKLRTGPIEPGPEVVHLRPRHDELGGVDAPARGWLAPDGAQTAAPHDARFVLPVPSAWLRALSTGDTVTFTDVRGERRTFRIGAGSADRRWFDCSRGAYLLSGTILSAGPAGDTRLGRLPARESSIRLAVGDTLGLTRDQAPGRPATQSSPAEIPCTLPEAFDAVAVGEPVWLDDGKFGGVARCVRPTAIDVEITTQVLDTLARTGVASRAEITDAAFGARAECVMLNKGPMIVDAITALDDILERMAAHRDKNTSLLRQLAAWAPAPPR